MLAPVSMTRNGAGHSSRVIFCQHPGIPPGPPRALVQGRFSGQMYGLGAPAIAPEAWAPSEYPLSPSALWTLGATSSKLWMVQ